MSAEVRRTKTADFAADKYDHEIRLVDSTVAGSEDVGGQSENSGWRKLARNPTKTSVKEQLSRRKYASWRKDRFDTNQGETASDGDPSSTTPTVIVDSHPDNERSQTVDFGGRPETADQEAEQGLDADKHKENKKKKKHKSPQSEIDILYENQRGAFFCGIPLYSHSSLLNFDPAAWVTAELKNSPVNITNAQVPDPSWMWAWKTWYVDMSGDVDEEGWQYSFSFGSRFSWHGTHPWPYSFARRRRWLRKRVKRSDTLARHGKEGTLEAAHHLNTDYFTIHSKKRDRSPATPANPDAQTARPLSYQSLRSLEADELQKPDEISDIPSLMKAIRLSTIDREKIDALKQFVTTSGEELVYLKDHIPEIMSTFVFQNSRRQILQFLTAQADQAQDHRDEHNAKSMPEHPEEERRIDRLLAAAEVAKEQISGLEYWSDRKHVLQTEDEDDLEGDVGAQSKEVFGEIRGISEKAQISEDVRVDRRLTVKGKQPERPVVTGTDDDKHDMAQDQERDQERALPLGRDDILIPENDNTNKDQ